MNMDKESLLVEINHLIDEFVSQNSPKEFFIVQTLSGEIWGAFITQEEANKCASEKSSKEMLVAWKIIKVREIF